MLGQVLVFALLFLSEWAAGLAARSGLAFTRHSPAVQTEVWVKTGTFRLRPVVYADVAHDIT